MFLLIKYFLFKWIKMPTELMQNPSVGPSRFINTLYNLKLYPQTATRLTVHTQAHTDRSGLLNVKKKSFVEDKSSHSVVGRSAAALRYHPVDVLAGILDVAGLTVDTVLSVDL